MNLMAKVDGQWFEVGAFYSDEHKHISHKQDMVWVYGIGNIPSGFVDVAKVEKFKVSESEVAA